MIHNTDLYARKGNYMLQIFQNLKSNCHGLSNSSNRFKLPHRLRALIIDLYLHPCLLVSLVCWRRYNILSIEYYIPNVMQSKKGECISDMQPSTMRQIDRNLSQATASDWCYSRFGSGLFRRILNLEGVPAACYASFRNKRACYMSFKSQPLSSRLCFKMTEDYPRNAKYIEYLNWEKKLQY